VAAGTYKPTTVTTDPTATFIMKNNVGIYGGFVGNEPSTGFNSRNPVTNVTILSGAIGGSHNSYHVVSASGTDNRDH
jgi:hypothetical protein